MPNVTRLKVYLPHVLLIALLVSIGTSVYFYQQLQEVSRDPNKGAQKELQEVVAKVSKLIVLPEGEVPVLATVTDPEKLKEQPFFAKAQSGYKVLVFSKAQKAYLYDPARNIIVDVGTTTATEKADGTTENRINTPKPAPKP